MTRRSLRLAVSALVLVALVVPLSACSKPDRQGASPKMPANVSSGPETLDPAPTAVVADTPSWAELPKPVADVFAASLDKGKFQAFAAMKQSTVQVRLKSAPKPADLFRALDAAVAFVPGDYTIVLNVYAPGDDGKDRYQAYEWTPMTGTLVKKTSADADQSWDAAITAVTAGSATSITPDVVKKTGSGELSLPPL